MSYDYIFIGFGLSAMLVLDKMITAELVTDKRILIIEPDLKRTHDRTWCFWEEGEGDWDALITKAWNKAFFVNEDSQIECLQEKYGYKMIESQRFYHLIRQKIEAIPNVFWKYETMISFTEKEDFVEVLTNKTTYQGLYLFTSALDVKKIQDNARYPLLNQHFVGWFVKTKQEIFRSDAVTFMDFSVAQQGNTRFMYVLPLSTTEALVEYTLFSPNLLSFAEYEAEIREYLSAKGISDFEIVSKEQGCIPMTAFSLWEQNTKRILHIGTAGGWTKASTGYTFKNSDKLSNRVIQFLKQKEIDFSPFKKANRFTFYDALFVRTLFRDNAIGKVVFSNLFQKASPWLVLKFLEERTTLWEEFKIITVCPKLPFMKSLLEHIKKHIIS